MEEIDLKELIDMFLRKKFLIILMIIVFAALGAIYTLKFITPEYQATTNLILVQIRTDLSSSADPDSNSITTTDVTLNSKLVQDYMEIIKSKRVLYKVIENLNLNQTYTQLKSNITVNSKSDTELIEITVTDVNPDNACKIANEVAEIFMDEVENLFNVRNVLVLDVAEINHQPSNINLSKNIVIFAFIGLITVSAYILLVNMLDTTVSTDTDIERAIKVPVLASIVLTEESNAKKIRGQIQKKPTKAEKEAYKDISNFSYLNQDNYIKTDEDIAAVQKEKETKKRRGGR